MRLGVILLAHEAFDRVAQLARYWAKAGCPVVIHLDAASDPAQVADLRQSLADLPEVLFAPSQRSAWGGWGLVAATQAAAELMLARFSDVGHVLLTSGACLPLRPVPQLVAHLARHPQTDFIESHRVGAVPWAKGGLEAERFTLFFPLGWRRSKRWFDRLVRWQRALGLGRRIPEGLVPHLGSQWWCLSRATLAAILNDPERPRWERYFKGVWIPDESYFQTLARRHGRDIAGHSLTWGRFDARGVPHVLYDDHLPLLRARPEYLARKVWPGAEALYRAFLTEEGKASTDVTLDEMCRAAAQRYDGQPGLVMQSAWPAPWLRSRQTPAPYVVLMGYEALMPGVAARMQTATDRAVHGALFSPEGAQFARGATVLPGNLSAQAGPRDADPLAFLRNTLRAAGPGPQALFYDPRDSCDPAWIIGQDPNARVCVITGAWVLPLWRSGVPAQVLRPMVARLQRRETRMLRDLTRQDAGARVQLWSLGQALAAPAEPLDAACHALEIAPLTPPDVPRAADLIPFLTRLRALGHHVARSGIPLTEPQSHDDPRL